jgi:hypothetical protein
MPTDPICGMNVMKSRLLKLKKMPKSTISVQTIARINFCLKGGMNMPTKTKKKQTKQSYECCCCGAKSKTVKKCCGSPMKKK